MMHNFLTKRKEYPLLLLENGLIKYQAGERTLKSTDKGIHFLRIHDSVLQLTASACDSLVMLIEDGLLNAGGKFGNGPLPVVEG
jgi:hypothetical protein